MPESEAGSVGTAARFLCRCEPFAAAATDSTPHGTRSPGVQVCQYLCGKQYPSRGSYGQHYTILGRGLRCIGILCYEREAKGLKVQGGERTPPPPPFSGRGGGGGVRPVLHINLLQSSDAARGPDYCCAIEALWQAGRQVYRQAGTR